MPNPRALACPSSLKGVLSAREAASALAQGLREWADVDELPLADGGEGTLEALYEALGGEWRIAEVEDAFGLPRRARWLLLPDGTAAVEAAEAIPVDPARLDPLSASSRGLGQLILAAGTPAALIVGLGGTANVDGGAGLREVLSDLAAPTRVACDVSVPLVDAARIFAAQKGAAPGELAGLETRLTEMRELAPYADLPGAGAAGGLGAALASLGGELVPGAAFVLEQVAFDPSGYALVVTGEGTVDRTTTMGKVPGEVVRRCREAGVRCVLFGGRIVEALPGVETVSLSGRIAQARSDLIDLGRTL